MSDANKDLFIIDLFTYKNEKNIHKFFEYVEILKNIYNFNQYSKIKMTLFNKNDMIKLEKLSKENSYFEYSDNDDDDDEVMVMFIDEIDSKGNGDSITMEINN